MLLFSMMAMITWQNRQMPSNTHKQKKRNRRVLESDSDEENDEKEEVKEESESEGESADVKKIADNLKKSSAALK